MALAINNMSSGLANIDPSKDYGNIGFQSGIQSGLAALQAQLQQKYAEQNIQAALQNAQANAAKTQAAANYWNQFGGLKQAEAQQLVPSEAFKNLQAGNVSAATAANTPGVMQSTIQKNLQDAALSAAQAKTQRSVQQENTASAANTAQQAVNAGFNQNFLNSLFPGMPAANSAVGDNGQPYQYPTASYTQWKPQDQAQYIANNNAPPPLPLGASTVLSDSQIDDRTRTKINAIPQVSNSIVAVRSALEDPDIQQFYGNNRGALIRKGEALMQNASNGQPVAAADQPLLAAYSKFLAFGKVANTLTADLLATSQTGSKGGFVMSQFQKLTDPKQQLNLNEAQDAINMAGQQLATEAASYVAGQYPPAMRQVAFNGLKVLQNGGYGPQRQIQVGNDSVSEYDLKRIAKENFGGDINAAKNAIIAARQGKK